MATERSGREHRHPKTDHRRPPRIADRVVHDVDQLDDGDDRGGEATSPEQSRGGSDPERVPEHIGRSEPGSSLAAMPATVTRPAVSAMPTSSTNGESRRRPCVEPTFTTRMSGTLRVSGRCHIRLWLPSTATAVVQAP